MSESDDVNEGATFEDQVRAALRAEAGAGPSYAEVLHQRVMSRVVATAHGPAGASPQKLRRVAWVLVALILALLVLFMAFHH